MIKGLLRLVAKDGEEDVERIVVLGLSGENMARLMADEPIMLDLAELGLPPQRVVIVGGKDEAAIVAHIERAAGAVADELEATS